MSQEKVKEFYSNDIVYRFDKNKKIIFGVVVDSYEASSDDIDDSHALQKGQIRVSWSNSSREQIWRQSKVGTDFFLIINITFVFSLNYS